MSGIKETEEYIEFKQKLEEIKLDDLISFWKLVKNKAVESEESHLIPASELDPALSQTIEKLEGEKKGKHQIECPICKSILNINIENNGAVVGVSEKGMKTEEEIRERLERKKGILSQFEAGIIDIAEYELKGRIKELEWMLGDES